MNVDKYLEKVTSRPSFNYFAFQATTLFVTFVASYIAIFQFVGIFNTEDLNFCFRAFSLVQIIIVLAVTFLEFIFFSIRKKLSQKLFSKSLIIIHILFTYLFYSVSMFFCPYKDLIAFIAILSVFIAGFLLYKAVIIFTIIPVVFLFIIETLRKLKLEPMQYMKNIWAFGFVITVFVIFFVVIVFAFYFQQVWNCS